MDSGISSQSFSDLTNSCLIADDWGDQFLQPLSSIQVIHTAALEPTPSSIVNPNVEVLAPSPLTERRKFSKVWEVFTTTKGTDGKEWAICKHCNKKYARSSKKETSNLLKHIEKCPSRRKEDQGKPTETTGITTPVDNEKKTASDKECNRLDMARMIIRHRCPWSVVEQDFSKTSLPTSTLQSQSTLKADILQVYREEKGKLYQWLKEISGRFSLTFNFWGLNHQFRNGCLITIHFVDNGWKLKKKILAFKKLQFWSCYWKKFPVVKSVLQDWNIDKKLCSITVQTTEEDDQMVREIKCWLNYQDSLTSKGKVLHCGCFIHILNLLVEEGLQEVEDVFQKIIECNSYIFSTPDNDRKFRIAVEHARSEGKKVISEGIPVDTTCSIQLLEKVLGFREAFHFLQFIDPDFSLNPVAEEWDKITRVHECLKVLAEVAESVSGSRCLTTNVFFPKVCSIYRSLRQWGKGGSSDIRLMAYKLKKKFEMYWSKCHLVLVIAVILDPRFKFDIVESWYREIHGQEGAEEHRQIMQDTLKEVYNEYAGGFKNSVAFAPLSAGYNMLDHLGMPLSPPSHGSESGKSQKSELERYLEEPKFPSVQELDILGWWCVNAPNFPTLANMARDFLAVPVSAALSDPTFRHDVLKIDPMSSDLDPNIMEALICTPDWLHMAENT